MDPMDLAQAYRYRLDWIASFVAVAEYGGFSAAATALYRSQPRISIQIAELELRFVEIEQRLGEERVVVEEARNGSVALAITAQQPLGPRPLPTCSPSVAPRSTSIRRETG